MFNIIHKHDKCLRGRENLPREHENKDDNFQLRRNFALSKQAKLAGIKNQLKNPGNWSIFQRKFREFHAEKRTKHARVLCEVVFVVLLIITCIARVASNH
jgi:hypothetical protein